MCGIAGFTHREGPPPEGVLRRAIASIHHRGPDQNGIFESACASLGAVRLKIQDLSGGDQPITDAATGTTIVFNGEVYNFRELRAELESLGHAFHSHCDTEVVLRAFLQWDTASFARLRGMFALALWQEPSRRLVVARDRMGIKPLYLHRNGRTARMHADGTAYILLQPDEPLPAYLPEAPPLFEIPRTDSLPEPSPWITLYISGGKKDKLSKTDIVGFLSKKGNLQQENIGKIEVLDFMSFVAVKKEVAVGLLEAVRSEKMKGKKYKIVVTS